MDLRGGAGRRHRRRGCTVPLVESFWAIIRRGGAIGRRAAVVIWRVGVTTGRRRRVAEWGITRGIDAIGRRDRRFERRDGRVVGRPRPPGPPGRPRRGAGGAGRRGRAGRARGAAGGDGAAARLRGESGRWGREDGEWRGDAMDDARRRTRRSRPRAGGGGGDRDDSAVVCVTVSFYCLLP